MSTFTASTHYSAIKAIAIALMLGLVLCAAFRMIYRLFWHPLARFPGPKLAAMTKWYETYYEILHGQGGAFMYKLDQMHAKYGPLVRINPNELHIRDPLYYRTLNAGAGARRDKYPVAANMLDAPFGIFGTVKHNIHRQRRAVIGPAFSRTAILGAEDLIRDQVEALFDLLCQRDVSECHACFLAFGTEVVSNYAFGYSMDLLSDMTLARDWQKTIKGVESLTPLAKQFTWIIPLAKRLPRWVVRFIRPAICRLLDVQDDMDRRAKLIVADQRQSEGVKYFKGGEISTARQAGILQAVLESDLPAHEKLPQRIGQEAFTILVAGGDTVAWTLSVAVFHILSNPAVLASLQKELNGIALPDSSLPSLRSLEKLPLLNAVLKESLRVWGVTTSRLPLVCPQEDLLYGSKIIPRGTPVGMTVRDILHDPTVYPDPLTFRLERWTSDPNVVDNERNFVAFSRGNRMCMGLGLAWAEMCLTLAMVVNRFDMELVEVVKTRDVDTVRDCFIGAASTAQKGINVRFRKKD